MEGKSVPITVNERFMAQQVARNILISSSDDTIPKVLLDGLMEVAKAVVKNELTSCGYSEDELVGFRLKCWVSQVENQEIGEVYAVDWGEIDQASESLAFNFESEKETFEEQPETNSNENPVSSEFTGRLLARLHEAVVENTPQAILEGRTLSMSTNINFRVGMASNCEQRCDAECPKKNNRKTQRQWCKENGRWVKKGCTGSLCRVPRDIFPDELL